MRIFTDACFFCDVGKGAVAIVAIQNVRAPIAYIDIQISVIIVIAGHNSQAMPRIAQAGLFRYVRKFPIAFIAIKCISRRHLKLRPF
ncbi:hypothetical protein ES703_121438 [subsurface metagenome]